MELNNKELENKLTNENYNKGFLIDEELMAGVSVNKNENTYMAYIVNHASGEVIGSQSFQNLFEAIRAINQIERNWAFQSASRCGGGSGGCGCGAGGCGSASNEQEESLEVGGCCSGGGCGCSSPEPEQEESAGGCCGGGGCCG